MDAMGHGNKKPIAVATSQSGSFTLATAEAPKSPGIVSKALSDAVCAPNQPD